MTQNIQLEPQDLRIQVGQTQYSLHTYLNPLTMRTMNLLSPVCSRQCLTHREQRSGGSQLHAVKTGSTTSSPVFWKAKYLIMKSYLYLGSGQTSIARKPQTTLNHLTKNWNSEPKALGSIMSAN